MARRARTPRPPQGAAGAGSAPGPGAEQLRHPAPPAATGGSVLCPRLTRRRARPAMAAPEAEAVPQPHQALAARSLGPGAGRVPGAALSLTRPEPHDPAGRACGGGPVTAAGAPSSAPVRTERTRSLSGTGTRWGGRDEPGWQQRVAHMCPRGDRCQVRGWGRVYRRSLTAPRVSQPRGCGRGPFPIQGKYLRFTGKFNLSSELDPLYGFNIRSFTAQCCKRQQPGL